MRALLLLAALLAAQPALAAQTGQIAVQRIVTLAPHLAELVCAAGGCERLVGVARYTDYPAAAARVPQVSDAVSVNLEQVLALRPDLILAWDGGTAPDIIARLRGLGLRVELVRIRGLPEVADALWELGTLLQTRAAAAAAVNRYYRQLDDLRNRYVRAVPLRVMYQIEHSPIYTLSALSPINQAIELCGGQNVFAGLPQISAAVSQEAVLAADPEVVVFAQQDNEAAIRAQWARWPQASAQKRGNLYAINADLLARQAPRLLDGVEQLCAALDAARAKSKSPRASRDPLFQRG